MWNEIKHGSEKQIHRKACANISYLPYLFNVMLLLVLLPAPLASASPTFNVELCKAQVGTIKLRQDVSLYINPTSMVTILKLTSNCGQDYEVTIKKTDIQTDDHVTDSLGRLWAIVSYRVDHDFIHLNLGGQVYPYQNQNECSSPDPLKVAFSRGEAIVALSCSVIEPYQRTYHRQYQYRSHIIFIPIGAIFLLLSLCCRCFYKRKNRRQPIAVSVSANPIIRPVSSQPNPVPPTMPPTHLPTPHLTPSQQQLPPPPYSQLPPSNLPPYSQLTPSQLPPSNLPPYSQLTPSQLPPSNLPPSQLPPSNLPPSQLPPSNLPPYSQLPQSTVDSELPPSTSSKDKILSKFKNQFAFKRLENDSA